MTVTPGRLIRRTINSIHYRLIRPLTGRDATNWASKTDFRKTHNQQFRILRNAYSLDEAAKQAVGGDFEAIGLVLRETLVHHGLGKHAYLIDVGCGSGRLANPLSEFLEGKYLGIDVVPDLLSYARNLVQRPDWRFEIAKGLTIPEQDQQADMVCFFSVFTHLLHEESYVYLREARRVLRPGGKIVLSFLDFRMEGHWSIFERNIQDNRRNITRFLVISKEFPHRTGNDKTSIIFSIKHEPGSLFRIIKNFNDFNINLTKIESRPTKSTTWEYNFYVDFEGHSNNPQISKMLEKIKGETSFMKILGSYPSAKLN